MSGSVAVLIRSVRRIGLAAAVLVVCASPAAGANLPELPRVFLNTTYAPPAGARVVIVNAGGNLQAALDQALPGEIIELRAGATFTGNFTLPSKMGTGWIYIRSSAHASLPAPGRRVTPAQAALMPKIVSPNDAPALTTDFGAHHYRFVGIEITTTWSTRSGSHSNLILLGFDPDGNAATSTAQLPHHITFDRCYVHGTPTGNVVRGLAANGRSVAVIDSYFADFHSDSQDSQAIAGWNGRGPFKIVNNYLEGAGENVMFGGADPSVVNLVPSDIEIRHNHIFKPLAWKADDPAYGGIPWVVKNLFELKNARRVLLEGNILEHNWAAGQRGIAVVFTPRNQDGTAPWSAVQDVTFRHNVLRHVADGFAVLGSDDSFPSQPLRRVHIHDNVIDDVDGGRWGDLGVTFFFLGSGVGSVIGVTDVTVDHNTLFHRGGIAVSDTGHIITRVHAGVTFTNNIAPRRELGFFGSGTGDGDGTLSQYFVSPRFTGNVMAGGSPSSYLDHPGNFFPASDAAIRFVDRAGGNYRLRASSPYKNAGTDGRDIGADIGAVNRATAGVLSGVPDTPSPPTPRR